MSNLVERFQEQFGTGRQAPYPMWDYWTGVDGKSDPLGSTWSDKPHRLVFDLINHAVHLEATIAALEAQLAEKMKVKKLEWKPFERFSTARTCFEDKVYGIGPWYEVSGDWTVRLNGKEFARSKGEDDAKAIAQSDYERRILSTLEATPPAPKVTEAVRGNWHGVILDGRNEHGSFVLDLPQRSIELEQDEEGYFLREDAEAILSDAERLGFSIGDAVVATFKLCKGGDLDFWYEYESISLELTALLYGSAKEQALTAAQEAGKPSTPEGQQPVAYVDLRIVRITPAGRQALASKGGER